VKTPPSASASFLELERRIYDVARMVPTAIPKTGTIRKTLRCPDPVKRCLGDVVAAGDARTGCVSCSQPAHPREEASFEAVRPIRGLGQAVFGRPLVESDYG
jgi:hypothetical protein